MQKITYKPFYLTILRHVIETATCRFFDLDAFRQKLFDSLVTNFKNELPNQTIFVKKSVARWAEQLPGKRGQSALDRD